MTDLVIEKVGIGQARRRRMRPQETAEPLRVGAVMLRAREVGKFLFERGSFLLRETLIDPRGVFLLKGFHKRLAARSAVFSGRRKGGTSPCQSNNPLRR